MPRLPYRAALLVGTIAAGAVTTPARAQTPSQCDAVPGNLFHNCGFEMGTGYAPDFWYNPSDQSRVFAGAEHSGSNGLRLESSTSAANDLYQLLWTVPGTQYDLSFWLTSAVDRTNVPTETMSVSWNGSTLLSFPTGMSAFDWTQYHYTVTGTGSQAGDTFLIHNSLGYRYAWVAFDDAVLTPVSVPTTTTPEPATLALLATGLGALAAVARRRRA